MTMIIYPWSFGYQKVSSFFQVMTDGNVAEFDHPYMLIQDEGGIFHQMARFADILHFNMLKDQARRSYQKRKNGLSRLEHVDDVEITHL